MSFAVRIKSKILTAHDLSGTAWPHFSCLATIICSTFSALLTLLHLHWLSDCSLNKTCLLLPGDSELSISSARILFLCFLVADWLTPFRSQIMCHFLRQPLPDHLAKVVLPSYFLLITFFIAFMVQSITTVFTFTWLLVCPLSLC